MLNSPPVPDPGGRRQAGMIEPVLLLLLLEHDGACGYELVVLADALPLSGTRADSAGVYRCLRSFEQKKLVRSEWDTSGRGAARRCYHLTELGIKATRVWADQLKQRRALLDEYLSRYRRAIPIAMERQLRRAKPQSGGPASAPPKRGGSGGSSRP
jgi:PadR family transcriptional regulator, regulatory protein PadR